MDNKWDKESLRKCSHKLCTCIVRENQEYCSPSCSAADDVEKNELQCASGHQLCTVNSWRHPSAALPGGTKAVEPRLCKCWGTVLT